MTDEKERITVTPKLRGSFKSEEVFDRDFKRMLGNLGIEPDADSMYHVDYRHIKAIMMCGSSSGIYTMSEALLNGIGGSVSPETAAAIRSLADQLSDALWDMTVDIVSGGQE